jgi:hypothetical protein
MLLGGTVSFIIVRFVVWRLTGTTTDPRLALQLLAGGVTVLVLLALSAIFSITSFYMLALFGLVSLGTFIAVLYQIGEFTRGDLSYFLELVNVRKMLQYIRGELKGK